MSYEAVIFDNDGVIVAEAVDSVLEAAATTAFEAVGVADPATEHVEMLRKGVSPETLYAIAERYGFDADEFWAARDDAASSAQIEATRNGGKPFFEDAAVVRELSVPASVVSSNQQATLDFLFSHYDLTECFVSVYGRQPTVEHLKRKKPHPYFVEQALDDLRAHMPGALAPADVLMVGDNESDVRAAHAAGLDALYLRRNGNDTTLDVTPEYERSTLDSLPTFLDG